MNLERLTSILEVVSQAGEASVAEICKAADLPKPTVYRMVQDLNSSGLLDQAGKGCYVLGTRLRRLTSDLQSDQAVLNVVAPVLKAAAQSYGAAFFVSRLRGSAVEIIHVEIPETGVSYLHPGLGKRPLHACSCSKAVAAFASEPLLVEALEGRLRAYTEFTLTDANELRAEFERIRAQGFAECVEEIERGMCSVAAPLAQQGLGSTMSIGATGSVRVFSPEHRAKIGEVLRKLTFELSEALGLTDQETRRAG